MSLKPFVLTLAFATTLLVVALAVIYYEVVLNVNIDPQTYISSVDIKDGTINEAVSNRDWIRRLKESTITNYSYPVSEIEIALQEEKPGFDKRFYKIVIDELDGYKFFCVNQVLSANNIDYSFYKDGGFVRLVVAATNYKELKSIMDTIKTYGIEYKIEE